VHGEQDRGQRENEGGQLQEQVQPRPAWGQGGVETAVWSASGTPVTTSESRLMAARTAEAPKDRAKTSHSSMTSQRRGTGI
jgi:hypothetical protein